MSQDVAIQAETPRDIAIHVGIGVPSGASG